MTSERSPLVPQRTERIETEIEEAMYVRLGADWNSRGTFRSSVTRIYLVTRGEGEITCSGERVLLRPETIYVIPTGVDFSYFCADSMEKLYFHVRLLRDRRADCFEPVRSCVVFERQGERIGRMLRQFRSDNPLDAALLECEVCQILCEALQACGAVPEPFRRRSELVDRALDYIDGHLSAALHAERIAAALAVSSSTLQKAFRREVGRPIGKYVRAQVMHRAERMLREGAGTVREISDALGFCDPFYFSRAFSKEFGLPPSRRRDVS